MRIASSLFEAFLKCPTKCYLQSHGETGAGNAYAEWLKVHNESYRIREINRLAVGMAPNEYVIGVPDAENPAAIRWRLARDFEARTNELESTIHAVERVPATGQRQPALFIPIRFIFMNKLTRDEKLLLAFDALVLAAILFT